MRAAVAEILRSQNAGFCGNALPAALERNLALLKGNAVAIVTGQQVGLFGGPAYTFYKALSALTIAAQLRKKNIEAVPIFWMASEDHDLAEINHVYWPSATGLERLDWAGEKEQEGRSVGGIVLGPQIAPLVRKAIDGLAGSASQEIGAILAAAYKPDRTFGSSKASSCSTLWMLG
jgi:hypothetical protein